MKGCDFVSGHCSGDAASCSKLTAPSAGGWWLIAIAIALIPPGLLAETAPPTYKAHCWACHGAKGAGDTMLGKNMNLRALGAEEVQAQSNEELFAIISRGKNRMPRYDRTLSRDQIRALVEYIRSLKVAQKQ